MIGQVGVASDRPLLAASVIAAGNARLSFASANESQLLVGSVAEWFRSGTTTAAQEDVATFTDPAVGTGYLQRTRAFQGAVRRRSDHKPASANRAASLGVCGQHAGVDKADTRMHAVAIRLMQ